MTEVQRGKLSATTVRRLSVRTEMPTPSNSPPPPPQSLPGTIRLVRFTAQAGQASIRKKRMLYAVHVYVTVRMYTYVCVQCIQIVESSNFRKLLKDDM